MDRPSAPVAEVDARARPGEVRATAVVGGIPLVVRPLRQLARLGWTAARVTVEDAEAAAQVSAALARYPVPEALVLEIVIAGRDGDEASIGAGGGAGRRPGQLALDASAGRRPGQLAFDERAGRRPGQLALDERAGRRPGVLALDARAVYRPGDLTAPAAAAASPEPLLRVRTPADAAAAERALFAQIRKTVDGDGFIAHHFIRPLSRPLTRLLLGTRVSPNEVTAAALVCAVAAALLAAAGGLERAALAGLFYWIGNALDCVDGDLARLRLESSRLGEWLDSMTDEISTFSLLAGLGVGLWRDGAGPEWLWIGVGGSAIGALTVARLYVDLHRMGLPIDSAQFPWFFSRPADPDRVAAARRSRFGQTLYLLGFLVRRDANVTGVTTLLLLGWREVATALVAAGAAVGALVTIAHYLVTALRPPTARPPR